MAISSMELDREIGEKILNTATRRNGEKRNPIPLVDTDDTDGKEQETLLRIIVPYREHGDAEKNETQQEEE
jgi:hypothetical protein